MVLIERILINRTKIVFFMWFIVAPLESIFILVGILIHEVATLITYVSRRITIYKLNKWSKIINIIISQKGTIKKNKWVGYRRCIRIIVRGVLVYSRIGTYVERRSIETTISETVKNSVELDKEKLNAKKQIYIALQKKFFAGIKYRRIGLVGTCRVSMVWAYMFDFSKGFGSGGYEHGSDYEQAEVVYVYNMYTGLEFLVDDMGALRGGEIRMFVPNEEDVLAARIDGNQNNDNEVGQIGG